MTRKEFTLDDLLEMVYLYCRDYAGYMGTKEIPLRAIAQQFGKRFSRLSHKRTIDVLAEDPHCRFTVNMYPGRASYYVMSVPPEQREQLLEVRRMFAEPRDSEPAQPE